MNIKIPVSSNEKGIINAILYDKNSIGYFGEVLNTNCKEVMHEVYALEKKGVIEQVGKYSLASLDYKLTEYGKSLVECDDADIEQIAAKLTKKDIRWLQAIKDGTGFSDDDSEENISITYLQDKGFIHVKGVFGSSIVLTDKGLEALEKEVRK